MVTLMLWPLYLRGAGPNKHCTERIQEQTVVRECLLSFGAESFAFQFAIQNLKDQIIHNLYLPVVLYRSETWSFTLREERMLRVLRRIFQPKRDEVTKQWRKLNNEELNDLYCSPNIVRVIESRRIR